MKPGCMAETQTWQCGWGTVCLSVRLWETGPVRDWTWTVSHLALHATSLICLGELCMHTQQIHAVSPSVRLIRLDWIGLSHLSHWLRMRLLSFVSVSYVRIHTTNTFSESVRPSYQTGLDRTDILHHTTSVSLISMQYVNVAMQHVYILQAHIHHKQCITWMWQVI